MVSSTGIARDAGIGGTFMPLVAPRKGVATFGGVLSDVWGPSMVVRLVLRCSDGSFLWVCYWWGRANKALNCDMFVASNPWCPSRARTAICASLTETLHCCPHSGLAPRGLSGAMAHQFGGLRNLALAWANRNRPRCFARVVRPLVGIWVNRIGKDQVVRPVQRTVGLDRR